MNWKNSNTSFVMIPSGNGRSPITITALQILVVIFFVELMIMLGFSIVDLNLNTYNEALLDATLLSSLSAPFIYYFIIRPFIRARSIAEEESLVLSRAIESTSNAVLITDRHGVIQYVNSRFTEITGYTKQEVLGKTPAFLRSAETPDDLISALWDNLLAGKQWKGEFRNRRKDGNLYWDRCSIAGVRDITGKTTHYVSTHEDFSHEIELSRQLNYQACHDQLTGLINRYEFEHRLERLLAGSDLDQSSHALCFMDLDQFKIINDTCGHAAGDALLHQLANVLAEKVRHRDTLARLGGDEFGLLMEHCDVRQAQRVAESILKTVRDFQFYWEGQSFRVGISIGLVPIGEHSLSLIELMKQADSACYMAKDAGRNRIHLYNHDDTDLSLRIGEMRWVSKINDALDENKFDLYLQPIESLRKKTDKRFEILLRMIDDDGSPIRPGKFLTAAERYDLMMPIDGWVVDRAFEMFADNPGLVEATDLFSINLSGQSITDRNVLARIESCLTRTTIPASKLCFEITETTAITNLSAASHFLLGLKQFGCQTALDDFGSGPSSFGYLRALPVDYLKIDGSLILDLKVDGVSRTIVKSIVEIAREMGIRSIAEFVEDAEVRDEMIRIGGDYIQGNLVGKPLPVDTYATSLAGKLHEKTRR